MNKMNISVTDGPTLGKEVKTVIGAISASVLIDKGYIPHHDSSNSDAGYQRLPSKKRVNDLAESLKSGNTHLPTAVLLSAREKWEDVIVRDGGPTLNLNKVDKLFIVDGQHRYLAIENLLSEAKKTGEFENSIMSKIGSLKIPFVCMVGADMDYEMAQFHIVNSNSRPVSTDLSLELLKKRAKSDPRVLEELELKDEDWKTKAVEIAHRLKDTSAIWKDRIRMANAPKAQTTINLPSLVTSLQPILKDNRYFNKADNEQQIQLLNAYWHGIEQVIPQAFITGKSKGNNGYEVYTLQKGVSVRVLHGLFNAAMDLVSNNGDSRFVAESYARVLEDPILKIAGINGYGDKVSGEEFWLVGKKGCVANFSNEVAMRSLKKMLDNLLPAPKYDDN